MRFTNPWFVRGLRGCLGGLRRDWGNGSLLRRRLGLFCQLIITFSWKESFVVLRSNPFSFVFANHLGQRKVYHNTLHRRAPNRFVHEPLSTVGRPAFRNEWAVYPPSISNHFLDPRLQRRSQVGGAPAAPAVVAQDTTVHTEIEKAAKIPNPVPRYVDPTSAQPKAAMGKGSRSAPSGLEATECRRSSVELDAVWRKFLLQAGESEESVNDPKAWRTIGLMPDADMVALLESVPGPALFTKSKLKAQAILYRKLAEIDEKIFGSVHACSKVQLTNLDVR